MSQEVFVVEDDVDIRQLLVHRLQRRGFDVETAGDGTDCLERLREREGCPDALVLDVMLPGLDGFALLDRLRSTERFADLPIVLLTARGSEADVVRAFELGADDYVTKPFSPSEVSARLARLT